MSEESTEASEKTRPTASKGKRGMSNAFSTIALVVAVTSLIMNIFLLGIIQDPSSRIDSLKAENSTLEGEVDALSARIQVLELVIAAFEPGTNELLNLTNQLQSQVEDLELLVADLESRILELENLTGSGGGPEPNVLLANAYPVGPDEWIVEIEGVSEPTSLGDWKAVLVRDIVIDSILDPLDAWSSGNITFVDIAGDGKLTTGDFFRVVTVSSTQHKLSIIWKPTGNERDNEIWET